MKLILRCLILFLPLLSIAQEDAWVYFRDKPNAQFYLDNPLEMLSQKSLDRRSAQGIALDSKDVPIHIPYINNVQDNIGIAIMARSKWLNALHIRGSVEDINSLISLPFVESVEFADRSLNIAGRMAGAREAKAVNKSLEAAAEFNYGNSARQIEMLNGHLLHKDNFTGTGMMVAVIDAGFPGVNNTQPFQRLRDNGQILGGYDFVNRSDDFYTGNSHGTLVLSNIGGYVENQLVGTAPDASYYLFITEDALSENPVEESYWVEAAEMADSLGVDVINTSLGYFLFDNPAYNHTFADLDGQTAFMTRGANIAFTRGMLCVTSAGNSGQTQFPSVGVPGDALNTLTLGAVDANEVQSAFSSEGPTADGRIKPDVVAQGVAAVVATPSGTIGVANGTSFSSPITAGLVACLWQALPGKTNAQLLQIIKESADRFSNPDNQYGYGVPDFYSAFVNNKTAEEVEGDKFILYPNPIAGENVTVVFPSETESATLVVFNNLGQLVMERTIFKDAPSFPAQALATGIYSYRIASSKKSKTGRLIRQ
ncbi:MAG: T9SS type A sorting domain-containing protein [Sphingobacteriaceae bacterium]|nr:MAG: T9SS type A sorting domain-containing protein [Sphingobacteriaceae bacterium]